MGDYGSLQPRSMSGVVFPHSFGLVWNGTEHIIHFWTGQRINGTDVAMKCKTAPIAGRKIPPLAMLSASTGVETYLIRPEDAASFLKLHETCHIAFHDVARGFWVLMEHFRISEADDAMELLLAMADRNQLHDTMLMDGLVRLATNGADPDPRDLAVVASEWAGIADMDKGDPYRLRYGEVIGKDWGQVEAGFFVCAAKDAIATALAHNSLRNRAKTLAQNAAGYMWDNAEERFGVLSEAIQVKGAIAFDWIGRIGMYCDRDALAAMDAELASAIDQCVKDLCVLPESATLLSYDSGGVLRRTRSGVPAMKERSLEDRLRSVLIDCQGMGLPPVPVTSSNLLSTGMRYWLPYTEHSRFIKTWLVLQGLGTMRQFSRMQADGDRVHPTYSPMKLTGRVSCSKPNLQGIPCEGGFREYFVAPPGNYLFTVDYCYVELVTLAAICLQRYGKSRLADVIREGTDPHCYTAALITRMSLDDFMAMEKNDPDRFSELRQKAKALNFGIPGGLGYARLQNYARDKYGVELTENEAEEWRQEVITNVYPELTQYLSGGSIDALATKLSCSTKELWTALDPQGDRRNWMPIVVRRVLSDEGKKDGSPYSANTQDDIWAALIRCCRNPDLMPHLQMRHGGPGLGLLCDEIAVTPTGRIRAGVEYTVCRNTPFQGTAADGAKLACFDLIKAGYGVVGFVHDEIIIELSVDADHTVEAERIQRIVCDAMLSVVNRLVPVRVKYVLSTCWSKNAEVVRSPDGRLLPWRPAQ